jgi:PleD family two-component response regulator
MSARDPELLAGERARLHFGSEGERMRQPETLSLERHTGVADSTVRDTTLVSRETDVMETKQLILIVDDEAELASTVGYTFEQEGFATRYADNGKLALERAVSGQIPDLIVLDLMLPDMSGTEVCRELRRTEATRSTPMDCAAG